MWRAKFYQSLPTILETAPRGARWLFLTITVKNCELSDLRSTLQEMNKSWNRFKGRKEFKNVKGWIRSTELTRNKKNDTAHPHFHCLLLVSASYFGKGYIKQAQWTDSWKGAARLDYTPIVDIRTIKPPKKTQDTQTEKTVEHLMSKAVCEVLKYSVKPSDMTSSPEWFLEMTKQTHNLRFIATGGLLKQALKPETEINNDDLIKLGDDGTEGENSKPLVFEWDKPVKRYAKRQKKE